MNSIDVCASFGKLVGLGFDAEGVVADQWGRQVALGIVERFFLAGCTALMLQKAGEKGSTQIVLLQKRCKTI
jgi:hypothetical protein